MAAWKSAPGRRAAPADDPRRAMMLEADMAQASGKSRASCPAPQASATQLGRPPMHGRCSRRRIGAGAGALGGRGSGRLHPRNGGAPGGAAGRRAAGRSGLAGRGWFGAYRVLGDKAAEAQALDTGAAGSSPAGRPTWPRSKPRPTAAAVTASRYTFGLCWRPWARYVGSDGNELRPSCPCCRNRRRPAAA